MEFSLVYYISCIRSIKATNNVLKCEIRNKSLYIRSASLHVYVSLSIVINPASSKWLHLSISYDFHSCMAHE